MLPDAEVPRPLSSAVVAQAGKGTAFRRPFSILNENLKPGGAATVACRLAAGKCQFLLRAHVPQVNELVATACGQFRAVGRECDWIVPVLRSIRAKPSFIDTQIKERFESTKRRGTVVST